LFGDDYDYEEEHEEDDDLEGCDDLEVCDSPGDLVRVMMMKLTMMDCRRTCIRMVD
jgi:hypothetical protein